MTYKNKYTDPTNILEGQKHGPCIGNKSVKIIVEYQLDVAPNKNKNKLSNNNFH